MISRNGLVRIVSVLVVFGFAHRFAHSGWAGSSVLPVVPSPPATPQASPAPSPLAEAAPLTDKERKELRREFDRAQATQLKALDHRHKAELRELDAAQKARFSEWQEKEREARRAYFKEHEKGPERREYIRGLQARRLEFVGELKAEREKRKAEQNERRSALVVQQKQNRAAFQEALAKGERPPANLWPQPGA